MKTHTSQFKTNIKTLGKEIDSKITYTIDNEEIVLGSENLNSVTPHYEGSILKSVMKQLDVESTVDIPVGTEINYQFGLKVGSSYEYLDFGNYIVKESEKQEDTNSWKIVAYDKMLYAMKDYEDVEYTFPMTVRSYLNAICTTLGLTFANSSDTFCNYNRTISADKYLDGEGNSLGYTFRDVLDQLAEVTASTICINEDDELEVRYITNTNDTIDEQYLKDVNVNFGEKFGPVNSIVLSRSAGSDNIYEQDSASITANGLCEIKISDNQIMNGNDRADYLPDLLSTLDGLEYYVNDYTSTGIAYYDLCDRYNVSIDGNTYSCVMFNDELDVTQGISELVHTDMPEETETDYKKADKTDRRINQTVLEVDKQGQTISALVSSQQTIQGEITDLQNTVEMFSVDLSQYNIVIPVDANKRPYSSSTIAVNYYGYYKGQQVTPSVSVSGSESGITVSTTSTAINFAISSSSAIGNNSYTYTATFTYSADGSSYTVQKKIDVVLGNAGNGVASVTELYYVSSSATAPSAPTSHVTTSSTSTYNAWNLQCPAYTSTYKYFYTCSEIKYANGTYSWSVVSTNNGLGGANSTASTANTNATTAVNTVNNLSIGGRNLLQKKYIKIYGSSYATGESLNVDDYVNSGKVVYTRPATSNLGFYVDDYSLMEPSTDYIISFKAKATSGTISVFYMFSSNPDNIDTSSLYIDGVVKRSSDAKNNNIGIDLSDGLYHSFVFYFKTKATITTTGTYKGNILQLNKNNSNAFTVDIVDLKWERGNKPTDWSPAPEDVNGSISDLNTYVDTNITNLQSQIDGAIQFWNGANIPTLNNYPASEWTTEAEKINHQADIYTVIQDVQGELKQGKSYRFDKVNNTWQWIELTDNELSAVQALANSKAKVYVTTPTVPYNIGDLWLNNNKLYRCKTAKTSGQSYSSSDWELATDYTNDAVANQALSAVNNLQIGGRNLLLKTYEAHTLTGTGITNQTGGNYYLTDYGKNVVNDISDGWNFVMSFDWETTATSGTIRGQFSQPYYGAVSPIITVSESNQSGHVVYSAKSTTTYSPPFNSIYFRLDNLTGTVTIKNAKLESGNKGTDWTLAPEDLETNIPDTIVGTQTANTRFWTGVASFAELKDGQQILYWNPYDVAYTNADTRTVGVDMRVNNTTTKTAGTLISSFESGTSYNNVWLNLTLANGTETGWIPCWYGSTNRLTGHYNRGSNIHLTYKVNTNIYGYQYTGWFADANYDSNNYDRIRFSNIVRADQMYLNSSRLLVAVANGNYIELNRDCSFRIDKAIVLNGSNTNILGTNNNTYLMYSGIDLRNNLNYSNFDNANITLGSSQVWNRGTSLTGSGTNIAGFAGAVGDHYTNSSTGYVYECKTAGTASTAKWDYVKSTAKPAGKKWYAGTTLSGTGTNKTGVAGTAGDYYWNTSSGTYYKCTTTGTASTAKWDYVNVLTKIYQTLYLRGTLNGSVFTVDEVPFTTTEPTTDDGLYYISIGSMYSVYQYGLFPEHPMYKYVNGEFKSLNQVAYDAQVNVDNIDVGGRNLLQKTNQGVTNWGLNLPSGGVRTITENVEDDGVRGVKLQVTTVGTGTWGYAWYSIANTHKNLKPDTTYTISFDVKTNLDTPFNIILQNGDGTNGISTTLKTDSCTGDQEWHSCVCQLKTKSIITRSNQLLYFAGNPYYNRVGWWIFKNLKMEEGTMRTTWTPAPEDEIKSLDVEYYLSTSNTQLQGGSWSTTAPPWTNDKYMWSRQAVTYGDGTKVTRNETCIAGAQGIPGLDGTSTYFYVRYSKNANGDPMTTAPQSDTKYMGVVTSTSSTAPTAYTAYAWSEIKGQKGDTGSQGIPGQPGADGTSSYLHIKWSDDGVNFTPAEGSTPAGKSPGRWQGTYVDTNATDSSTFSDYNWVDTGIYVQDELNALGTSIGEVDARLTDTNTNLNNNYYNKSQVDALSDANANNITIVQQRLADLQVTSDGLVISVDNILSNGVSSVTTSAGYKFDENGLNITKTGSEVSNLLDNTGMFVKRNSTEMLGADATGVRTENLWVKKYLQIGTNSRLEDYESNRTACFYIGGAS